MDKIKNQKCLGYSEDFTETYIKNVWESGKVTYDTYRRNFEGIETVVMLDSEYPPSVYHRL